ncbi:helix-turn-helix domain-containing protein [Arthrobacter sp. TMN-50]
MPPKSKRTLEVENGLAKKLAHMRMERGLTYEGLSQQMRAVGCDIHASGIQKTEKSGRRITVEELVAYSLVFDCSLDSLLGHRDQTVDVKAGMSNFGAARRLKKIQQLVDSEYRLTVDALRQQISESPELRGQIEDRVETETALLAEEMFDGSDISLEHLEERFWSESSSPTLAAAWDILKDDDHG